MFQPYLWMDGCIRKSGNAKAQVLANTLDAAIMKYLENQRTPSRKVRVREVELVS